MNVLLKIELKDERVYVCVLLCVFNPKCVSLPRIRPVVALWLGLLKYCMFQILLLG